MSEQALEMQTDEALLAAVARRDEEAFGQLYDRYSPTLFAVCLRILRRPHDAQAVLSDIFWEVWHHAERFNPNRGSARTYLVMLARSRAIGNPARRSFLKLGKTKSLNGSTTRTRLDWRSRVKIVVLLPPRWRSSPTCSGRLCSWRISMD
jgi:hypothetical protein